MLAGERPHGLSPLVHALRLIPVWVGLAVVAGGGFGLAWSGQGLARSVSIITLLTGLTAGWNVLVWRRTAFGFDADGDFRVETGVVNRTQSRVQTSRVQSVEIATPLLARPFGLTELVIDLAGTGQAKVKVAYLTSARAHQIRDRLLARAAELERPVVLQDTLLAVPPGRLLAALLLRLSTVGLLIATVLLLGVTIFTDGWAAVPIALVTGGVPLFNVIREFIGYYGFTLTRSEDGLRVRSGLTSTEQRTIPPARVQAVEVVEPLIWRRLGWVRIRINVAGTEFGTQPMLAPVALRADLEALLAQVLPDVELAGLPWMSAPHRARWRAPVQHALLAVAWTAEVIAVRHGRVTRQIALAPHGRVQSVRWTQGPWQRALGLATMHADSTPGPVRLPGLHLDQKVAWEVMAAEIERVRAARPQGLVVAVEGGVEATPGAAAGEGFEGAGDGVAPEQQTVGPGELSGLEDGTVGQGDAGARGDVGAGFDDAVVAEADADAGIRPDQAAGSDGDDRRTTP